MVAEQVASAAEGFQRLSDVAIEQVTRMLKDWKESGISCGSTDLLLSLANGEDERRKERYGKRIGSPWKPGEEVYRYEIDGADYLVLPDHDGGESVRVIDLTADHMVGISWYEYDKDGSSRIPRCECREFRYDRETRKIAVECSHWKAWKRYFYDYEYEPPQY